MVTSAARGGRGDPGQDGDHRVRLLLARQDAQPAQSRAHARRLLERLGRGGGRRHGAARARQPDQRLGDPAGRVLRRLRLQADAWPDPAQRRAAALAHARPRRAYSRAASTTLRCLLEQLQGYDEGDPDTRPRARIPFQRARRGGAADPADARVRQDAALGARRRRREGGFRRAAWRRSATGSRRSSCAVGRRGLGLAQTIMEAEMAANLEREWRAGKDQLSAAAARADRARARGARGRLPARRCARSRRRSESFDELFMERYDAILTPAALGTAPQGLGSTGDPVVLHAVDAARDAGAVGSADAGREPATARGSARRAQGLRRAPHADSALAGREAGVAESE